MPTIFENLLDQLDELKTNFEPKPALHIEQLLRKVSRNKVDDAQSLIRLHELLLFVRAHPHNSSVRKLADAELRAIPFRVERLEQEADVTPLGHPEVSGIAGTSVTDTFSYQIVQWLRHQQHRRISVYWEWLENENRLADLWPKFIPLLAEDALVEANVPYLEWLRNARGKQRELSWLLDRIDSLKRSEPEKAASYNALQLYVEWRFPYRDSRTGARLSVQEYFYHDAPMIQRREVKLKEELRKPAPRMEKLSVEAGQAAIDLARTASTVRYRELYGFTHGDPKSVVRVSIGRGVELFIITLPPDKRLPLRAYHSVMIYKNGVPIGYFEGLSLFERMESGFNLYYTFRDGETAWLYARVLHVMRNLTGVTAFTLDPYQIGFENEEGIASGAFWFYRKLGFRPTRPASQKLTESEEAKIQSRKNYRTSASVLRRLAAAPMILELDESRIGDWDHFQLRDIGFALQRLMVKSFGGDASRMRDHALAELTKLPGTGKLTDRIEVLTDLASTFLLIDDYASWSSVDQELLGKIVVAKATADENRYLRLMQQHSRLREALIKLGT
jgi:hypothetical protein